MPLRKFVFLVVIAFLASPAFAVSDLASALRALREGSRSDRIEAVYWLSHHMAFSDAVTAISGEAEVAAIEALLQEDNLRLKSRVRPDGDRAYTISAKLGAAKLLAQARLLGTPVTFSAEDLAEYLVLYSYWLSGGGSSDESKGSVVMLLHSLRGRSSEVIRFLKEVGLNQYGTIAVRLDALAGLVAADADREGDLYRALGRCVLAAARTEYRVRALALFETALPRIRDARLLDDETIHLAILILAQARELVPTTAELCHRLIGVRVSDR